MQNRKRDLIRFYSLLHRLENQVGGRLLLTDCSSKSNLPSRGIYFFMETSEMRSDTGDGFRVVRVGTHGLKSGSRSTLWKRLSQHKGTINSGAGNHRGSIFRLLIGSALADKVTSCTTWGQRSTLKGDQRLLEMPMEQEVSAILRKMPFLYLEVDDVPGPESLRGFIERNSIALLSNFQKPPLDPPSEVWRGHQCDREKVRLSGLWNQNHINEAYDPAFLQTLELMVEKMRLIR